MNHMESQAQKNEKAPKSLIRNYLPILMIWNILFIAEIALHLILKDDLQFHSDVQKILFLSQHLKATTLLLFCLVLAGVPIVYAGRLIGNRRFAPVIPFLIWPAALLYAASWYGYKVYGQFYTIDILQPLYHDPLQIFQHLFQTMSSWAIILPLAVLAFLFIMQKIVRYLQRRIPDQVVKPYLAANLILCLLFLIGSVAFEHKIANEYKLVMDPKSGVARQLAEVYHERVEMQSNPIVTLLYGAYYTLHPSNTATIGTSEYPIERRKRISLAKYIQNVDPNKVRHFNIILLLVESLRMDQLTDFGGSVSVMENLEQLERRSIRFIDNYTQASHSNYADLCPLSSHYPLRSRAMYYYPENAPYPKVLIYDILKNVGYRTAIISSQNEKWGNITIT
jgi:glucan phosphoethanolaminetransferase (alkaline phosphatase superfamily)